MNIYDSKYPELTEENLAKMVMTTFFFNMTYEDFQNPLNYLQNIPHMHPISNTMSININGQEYKIRVIHETNNINLETIDRLEIFMDVGRLSILLPHVNYSINGDKAYIKCIQSSSDNNPYQQNLAPLLPKVSGTSNNFMRNINPLHLLSLTIAIKAITEQTDVKEFIFPTLMPIRYNGTIETLIRKRKQEAKKNGEVIEDEEQLREEVIQKCNSIQTNITNKYINTIFRFSYHINNYRVQNDEFSSYLNLARTSETCSGNNILNSIMDATTQKRNFKK